MLDDQRVTTDDFFDAFRSVAGSDPVQTDYGEPAHGPEMGLVLRPDQYFVAETTCRRGDGYVVLRNHDSFFQAFGMNVSVMFSDLRVKPDNRNMQPNLFQPRAASGGHVGGRRAPDTHQ